MRISAMLYVLRQGLKNILRNKLFSLASIATIVTCIFLFGTCYAIIANLNYMVQEAEENVAVTVFFDEGISEENIENIGNEILSIQGVGDINFVSAKEAWETFKAEYFADNEELAEGFAEDNPLANSASYQVTMEDISMQAKVCEEISNIEGVRKINSSESLADTLMGFNSLLSYFSITIIALLLIVSIFLISNTISVGVAVRKEEIAIMRLIGARNSFIRAPFLIEGVLLGAFGAIIPLGIIYFLYNEIISVVLSKYVILANLLKFLSAGVVFRGLAPMALAMGIVVGLLGSGISIRKHLRV